MKLSTRLKIACVMAAFATASSQAEIVDNPAFNIENMVIVWSADELGNAPIVTDFVIRTGGAASADLIEDDAFTVVTGTLDSTNNNPGTGGFPLDFTGSPTGDFNTDTNNNGVLDAGDSLSPFQLDADFSVNASTPRSSFYVASNSAFSISAEVTDVEVDPVFTGFSNAFLDLVDVLMEVAPVGAARTDGGFTYGSAAQPPHSGGEQAGFSTPVDLLDLLNTPTTVFAGNQRTAATPGSIADQSVRFDVSYPLVGATVTGYDLSLGVVDFGVTVEYTVFIP
ncbi:MAG: hypothetical protein ABJG15_17765 [Hyphomonadaceae bacterium]